MRGCRCTWRCVRRRCRRLLAASTATHALTAGAIGLLTLGMMTRSARGHTARPLRPTAPTSPAYGLVPLARCCACRAAAVARGDGGRGAGIGAAVVRLASWSLPLRSLAVPRAVDGNPADRHAPWLTPFRSRPSHRGRTRTGLALPEAGQDLPARGQRLVRHLALDHGLADAAVFYGLPWLQWNGRQAGAVRPRPAALLRAGLVLFPQDFIYLTALLVMSALALFFFTAVAGRLWCGYACPQTVYTEIFLWIERRIEGDRQARMRLDKQPWGAEKLLRKGGKHAAWGAVAVHRLHVRRLLHAHPDAGTTSIAPSRWAPGSCSGCCSTACHLRQRRLPARADVQVHVPVRPLPERADRPRLAGHRLRHAPGRARAAAQVRTDPRAQGLGDCIDCTLCVQVCPTGIDIRNGLQNECIGCAACIDACDQVMDRLGSPRPDPLCHRERRSARA
jgi:ferredoxin